MRFETTRNAMRIDEAWAHVKVARLPPYVFGVLSERGDALLKSLQTS